MEQAQKRLEEADARDFAADEQITKTMQGVFRWDFRDEHWLEQYKALIEYKKEHGNCSVPSKQGENGTQESGYTHSDPF